MWISLIIALTGPQHQIDLVCGYVLGRMLFKSILVRTFLEPSEKKTSKLETFLRRLDGFIGSKFYLDRLGLAEKKSPPPEKSLPQIKQNSLGIRNGQNPFETEMFSFQNEGDTLGQESKNQSFKIDVFLAEETKDYSA